MQQKKKSTKSSAKNQKMKTSKLSAKAQKAPREGKKGKSLSKGLDRMMAEANKNELKEIKKLLSAKNPDKYIDFSVKSPLSSTIKGSVTRYWLNQNGLSIEDIKYARNRHPYWKDKKQTNHSERTKKRFEQYNYSSGSSKKWSKEELAEFIKINDDKSDRELAEHFTRSIPSIQGIRRRINLGVRILEAQGERNIKKSSLSRFVKIDEKVLRRELSEISSK